MSHLAAFGLDSGGELGQGFYGPPALTPQPATTFGEGDFTQVALGGVSYALRDGLVYASGVGKHGGLGQGNREDSATAVLVPFAKPVVQIAAAGMHALVLHGDGTASTLGANAWGTVGNGRWGAGVEANIDQDALTPYLLPDLENIIAVAAGGACCAALRDDGTVLMWGENSFGQLGDGTKEAKLVPTPVRLPEGAKVVEVVIGGQASIGTHTLFLLDDGSVLGCGARHEGQLIALGSGLTVPGMLPTSLAFNRVRAGQGFSFGRTPSGALVGWGKNSQSCLAQPVEGAIYEPVEILPSVEQLAVGFHYCVALTPQGVMVWGRNDYGELGDGTKVDKPTPTLLQTLTRPGLIASGSWHTFAVQAGVLGPARLSCIPTKGGLLLSWIAPTSASAYRWRLLHRVAGTSTFTGVELPGTARSGTVGGLVSGTKYEVSLYNKAWGDEKVLASAG